MQIEDCFWSPVISKMCNEIIPYQYEVLNDEIEGIPSSHAIENFRIASGQKNGKYVGMLFQDSDVAKWIEAAAYSLKVNDDPEIRKKIEDVIDLIEQTQQEDGYLDTYYICEKPDQRLKNIAHGHEMYCAGTFTGSSGRICGGYRGRTVSAYHGTIYKMVYGPDWPG